jgi:hypothetical protein
MKNLWMRTALALAMAGMCFAVLFSLTSERPRTKVELAFVGKPVVSGSFATFTITNSGDSPIYYLACPPQMKSGGVWSQVEFPRSSTSMLDLPAKQSFQLTVGAPAGGTEWRLPVLWGLEITPTVWQRLSNKAQLILTGHSEGVGGPLSTTYSAEVSP